MKKLYFTFAIAIFSMLGTAQDLAPDSSWKVEGYGAINLNQVSFTNWAAGGDNSISFSLVGFLQAKYARNKHNWDNSANLQYGLIRTDEFGLRKNEDKIELESKYGYILNKKKTLLLSALGNFKSQFANGYNYPNDSLVVSKFAAPGYLTLGIGLDWKPKDYFSLFISPATGKITFIRDQTIANFWPDTTINRGAYGNEIDATTGIGEKQVFQFGAYFNAKFQKEVVKNVTILSKLELFQNYTGDTDESKMVDVNWETAFLFKINEWLAASLTLNLIYDKEISIPKDENDNGTIEAPAEFDDRVQFKEALGVGLTYKFNNKKRTGRETK